MFSVLFLMVSLQSMTILDKFLCVQEQIKICARVPTWCAMCPRYSDCVKCDYNLAWLLKGSNSGVGLECGTCGDLSQSI